MPFCTNPKCPGKERTGTFAEYRDGITQCPECGSQLTDNPVKLPGVAEKIESDLTKKIFITIGLLVFFRLLCLIPLPGVELAGLPDSLLTRYFGSSSLSICALGIMPYISAYFFVEMLSLVIPPLKRWRGEKREGRRKLTVTARWLTLFLSLVQGAGIAISLARMTAPDGSLLVAGTGFGFKVMIIVTLTACVFINLWIADMITSKGLGNGISMLIITGMAFRICSNLVSRLTFTSDYGNFMEDTIGILLIFFAAGAVIYFMERGEYKIKVKLKNNSLTDLPFKYNTAGIVPAVMASSIVMVPASVTNFYNNYSGFLEYFRYGSRGYYITYGTITVVLFFFFVSLYYNPDKILSFLGSKDAEPVLQGGISFDKLLDKKLTILSSWGALYLLVYSVLLRPGILQPVIIYGLDLIVVICIILDIINDIKARRQHGYFVKIDEIQKPYEAGFLKNLLEQNGIPCFLEGYYHRSLYYFFGPFIPVSLYVQRGRESEAFKITADQGYQ